MKPITLPFDFAQKLIVLSVVVNGKKSLRVVLDTGMPGDGMLLFKSRRVDEADLDFSNQSSVQRNFGNQLPIQFARNVVIDFPRLRLPQQSVLVIDGNPFPSDLNIDGILGYALLSRYTVKLDFDNHRMRLWKPADYQRDAYFTELPISFSKGLPFVPCLVGIRNGGQISISAYLNLGAASSIVLNSDAHEEFRHSNDALETNISSALGGTMTGQVERIDYLELAGFRLESVIAYSCSGFLTKASCQGEHYEASIGTDLLRRFIAVIDYANKRLLLSPSSEYANPFHSCITGLAVRKTQTGHFRIEEVVKNSPASEAGLQQGDIIVRVNEVETNKISTAKMNNMLELSQQPILMLLCRKQVLMKLALKPHVLA